MLLSNKKEYATTWVNLKNLLLSKRSQTPKMHTVLFHHGWWLGFTWVEHKQLIQVMEIFHILVVVVYKFTVTLEWVYYANSVQFGSVAQSCPTLCNPMNCSTPGLPVHHQLPEFTQTHVHWVSDAIQPSHPVVPFSSCPQSLPALGSFPMSQLFAWGGQNIGVSALSSFLPKTTQDWSPLGWTGWISLQSKGLSSVFSNTTVQKHQFFGAQLSSQSKSHIHTWPQEKP